MTSGNQDSAPDPLIGRTIDDRYRITGLLAHGGMATVYVALDLRLDRPVALKVIHPHLAPSGRFTSRFRREARSAAKISDVGVVPIYDQGEVEGRSYLVMELIHGPSLRQVLAEDGPLSLEQSLNYLEQILSAVGAAHAAGVIHRDLKPENVLIAPHDVVKVADFGLARVTSEETMTSPDSLMGTAAYLAPEASLPGPVDERTDIYSAGLILFEMVTGRLPWIEASPAQIAFAHVNEDVPAPSSLVAWVPPQIDVLVASLCARDPGKRPASAGEALSMLRGIRVGLPSALLQKRAARSAEEVSASPDAQPTAFTPPAPPAVLATVPIAQQVVYTSGTHQEPVPQQKRRSGRVSALVLIFVLVMIGLAAGGWWWVKYGPGSYATIPDVAGQNRANAEVMLDELNLAYVVNSEYSDDVAEDVVIGTNPRAGQRVHKSETLTLTVSRGIEMVSVPDLSQLTPDAATRALENSHLQLGNSTEVWSDAVPVGRIVMSSPVSGQQVAHGSTVDIQVSKGPEPITVPGVVGLDVDDAIAQLTGAGLTPKTTTEFSSIIPEGQVISQNPTPEAGPLKAGDQVILTVSAGAQSVEVPDVVGLGEDEATAALEDSGFQVKINRKFGLFAVVTDQKPEAGQTAEVGSTVTLTIR